MHDWAGPIVRQHEPRVRALSQQRHMFQRLHQCSSRRGCTGSGPFTRSILKKQGPGLAIRWLPCAKTHHRFARTVVQASAKNWRVQMFPCVVLFFSWLCVLFLVLMCVFFSVLVWGRLGGSDVVGLDVSFANLSRALEDWGSDPTDTDGFRLVLVIENLFQLGRGWG